VELLDYRPKRAKESALGKPDRTRVVLHPNAETLWADICLLNQNQAPESKWSDRDALEVEARLLVRYV
jgi:transcription factor SPT20